MPRRDSFDPAFQAQLPLPLARLYARAHHAKGDRERHDYAFHLVEAGLKLAAAALVAAYRTSGERSPRVDAALRALALPSLGQWRHIFHEALTFLGKKTDPLAVKIFDRLAPKGGDGAALGAFAALAKASAYRGRRSARVGPLDVLDLLPAYRNSMSDAHGSIKADLAAYREATPALLELARLLFDEGALFGGGRLVHSEEVKMDLAGARRVVWMDLSGPTAFRRQPYEGEPSVEEILPGKLYLETAPGRHVCLHPLVHYPGRGSCWT